MKQISTFIAKNKVNIIVITLVLAAVAAGWVITYSRYINGDFGQ